MYEKVSSPVRKKINIGCIKRILISYPLYKYFARRNVNLNWII